MYFILKIIAYVVFGWYMKFLILSCPSASADIVKIPASIEKVKAIDTNERKPHIIIFMADDLGWNDVSFHGSNQIPTPNIDAIAYNGIIFNGHYIGPSSTATRASLLTGRHFIKLGLQHGEILDAEPRGLLLSEKLLPEVRESVK